MLLTKDGNMDNDDYLSLIKQIMDMCGQNNYLRSRVDMQAKEITNLRAVSASLDAKVGLASNTKAVELANSLIYQLEEEVLQLKRELSKFTPVKE
jgi:hypothetical protein